MTWILIIFAHTGVWSKNDSNSLATAVFATEQHCVAAGEAAKKMGREGEGGAIRRGADDLVEHASWQSRPRQVGIDFRQARGRHAMVGPLDHPQPAAPGRRVKACAASAAR